MHAKTSTELDAQILERLVKAKVFLDDAERLMAVARFYQGTATSVQAAVRLEGAAA